MTSLDSSTAHIRRHKRVTIEATNVQDKQFSIFSTIHFLTSSVTLSCSNFCPLFSSFSLSIAINLHVTIHAYFLFRNENLEFLITVSILSIISRPCLPLATFSGALSLSFNQRFACSKNRT